MGRQIRDIDLAYSAGFLDGDGSIMFQVKKRNDTPRGKRLMFTICLYQDTRHEKPLFWMRNIFGIGYISRRNDGMTELRINGYEQVQNILTLLRPYLRFKKQQVDYLFRALAILNTKSVSDLTKAEKQRIATSLLSARRCSYQSGMKTQEKLEKDLQTILAL